MPCGALGDYSLVSLGGSSPFGTGGSGCLVLAFGENDLANHLESCDGRGYDTADGIYAPQLTDSLESLPDKLECIRQSYSRISGIMTRSDFWLQRGSGRQKSSFTGTVVTAQDEPQCNAAVESLVSAGLAAFVRRLHVHRKSCFEHGCRGLKNIENATAVAPRSFMVDIAGAVNAGRIEKLAAQMTVIAESIHA